MRPAGIAAYDRRTEARTGVYSYEQRHEARLTRRRRNAAFRANEAAWSWFRGAADAGLPDAPRSGGSPARSVPRPANGGSRA